MTTRGLNIGGGKAAIRWIAAAALASACAVALSACEENGPAASSEPAAAAPKEAPSDLMGAPQGQAATGPGAIQETPLLPGGDTTRTPQYAPPTAYPPAGPAYAPAPPPPPAYPAPAPPAPPAYASHAPTEIIAMQPIPNPPEGATAHGHWRAATHHRHGWWGPVYAAPAAGHAARHHYTVAANQPTTLAHHAAAPAHHAQAQATPQLLKPKAPGAKTAGHKGVDQGTVAAASGGSTAAATNETANTTGNATSTGDARYDALQTALTSDIAHGAILNAPRQIQPGQSADVTLTIPGDFAQTLRTEAASQNLSDQATSANLEATLSGDGYTIVPNETQALPLTLGAPTVFHWKVTPQGATQGALHADLRANLLAANHVLNLGTIKAHSGLFGRVIGVGLLVVIALVLLGWVTRSRRPTPSSGAKPRPNHQSGPST